MGGFPALLALALILASDVIRGACGQSLTEVPATLLVATRISLGSTFTFNFTVARCTNLPRTNLSAVVQWTTAPGVLSCKNITLWNGPSCTGESFQRMTPDTTKYNLTYGFSVSARCNIDNMCQYAKCPAGSTCKTTTDTRGVTCACNQGLYASKGACQAGVPPPASSAVDASAGWPTEVTARIVVATPVKVGRYSVSFDPYLRCATVPDGTSPAGVSTPVSVQWGSSSNSSSQGGVASAPCVQVAFFRGSSCDDRTPLDTMASSSIQTSITPISPLAAVACRISMPCRFTTCPPNSVCLDAKNIRAATCKCEDGYVAINDTCQDKCMLSCMANNAYCVRDAVGTPQCFCNKGYDMSADNTTCAVDKCYSVNCGPNGKCIKKANGDATCACNTGFQMPPNNLTCVDKCRLVTCTAKSTCVKDANGDTSCECITGFERLPGNDTCVDKCASVDCGTGGKCKTDAYGNPECTCITGFTKNYDDCIDNCDWFGYDCWSGSCKKDTNGSPYCDCGKGYRQTADGRSCIDICELVDCGEGTCVKRYDEEGFGHAECDCPAGYQVAGSGRCTDICNVVCPASQTCRRNGDYITYCTQWDYCDRDYCGYGGTCRIDKVKDAEYCLCDPGYKLSADQLSCI
ncbi:unnamed protein product, partial [Closterium sp. Naga37s-1]